MSLSHDSDLERVLPVRMTTTNEVVDDIIEQQHQYQQYDRIAVIGDTEISQMPSIRHEQSAFSNCFNHPNSPNSTPDSPLFVNDIHISVSNSNNVNTKN